MKGASANLPRPSVHPKTDWLQHAKASRVRSSFISTCIAQEIQSDRIVALVLVVCAAVQCRLEASTFGADLSGMSVWHEGATARQASNAGASYLSTKTDELTCNSRMIRSRGGCNLIGCACGWWLRVIQLEGNAVGERDDPVQPWKGAGKPGSAPL